MKLKIERIKFDSSNFKRMRRKEKNERRSLKLIELKISYLKMKLRQ